MTERERREGEGGAREEGERREGRGGEEEGEGREGMKGDQVVFSLSYLSHLLLQQQFSQTLPGPRHIPLRRDNITPEESVRIMLQVTSFRENPSTSPEFLPLTQPNFARSHLRQCLQPALR